MHKTSRAIRIADRLLDMERGKRYATHTNNPTASELRRGETQEANQNYLLVSDQNLQMWCWQNIQNTNKIHGKKLRNY